MSLVLRLQDEIDARVKAIVPEISETIWDASRVNTFIEQLSAQSSNGHQPLVDLETGEKLDGDWHRVVSFTGVAATALKSDSLAQFNLDPLWVDLTETSLVLTPQTSVLVGGLSCRCRASFDTVRQSWSDQGLITTLRFTLNGSWVRREAGQTDFQAPRIREGLSS